MLRRARVRVMGHLNYYAINTRLCNRYVYHAQRILFKWLNRKSQRKTYTWVGFDHALRAVGWPRVRIRKDLNPYRRAEARLERPTEEPDVWEIRLSGNGELPITGLMWSIWLWGVRCLASSARDPLSGYGLLSRQGGTPHK